MFVDLANPSVYSSRLTKHSVSTKTGCRRTVYSVEICKGGEVIHRHPTMLAWPTAYRLASELRGKYVEAYNAMV